MVVRVLSVVKLLPVERSGRVALSPLRLPEIMRQNCSASASFYEVVGFHPPWISYVSIANGQPVGGGGFKGPPVNDRVEIAYYTLPELEGRGWATATARELIRIAAAEAPSVVVVAQTLPEQNASTALLKKLGFGLRGSVMHPEDGEVWEWSIETWGPGCR